MSVVEIFGETPGVHVDGSGSTVIVRVVTGAGSGGGPPTGGAGGALSGTYPNPGLNQEAVHDLVAAFLEAGDNVTLDYDDPGGRLTISAITGLTFASDEPIDLVVDGDPIVSFGTGDWDALSIREPDGPKFDPVTGLWILVYSGREAVFGNSTVGAVTSPNRTVWTPAANPITGLVLAEDPYILKDARTGLVARDSAGRALMYAEEKIGAAHRGIIVFRSAPYLLTGWTLFGRVIDRGAEGEWDETDRTSPTAFRLDGVRYMLFEGRAPGHEGRMGFGWADDDTEDWTTADEPVITPPAGWDAVVPDEVTLIGGLWVVKGHGLVDGSWQNIGRWCTRDHPSEWGPGSFVEMPGNPITTATDTVMGIGNDPKRGVMMLGNDIVPVVVDQGGDLSEISAAIDDLEDDVATLGSAVAGIGAAQDGLASAIGDVADRTTSLEGDRWLNAEADPAGDGVVLTRAAFDGEQLVDGEAFDAGVFGPPNAAFGAGSTFDLSAPLTLNIDWGEPGEGLAGDGSWRSSVAAGIPESTDLMTGVDVELSEPLPAGTKLSVLIVDAASFAELQAESWSGGSRYVTLAATFGPTDAPELGVSGALATLTLSWEDTSQTPPATVTVDAIRILTRPSTAGGGVELGETSSTAYRGDRGKTAYDHSQVVSGNPHGTTAADVGAATSSHSHAAPDVTSGQLATARVASGTATAGHVPTVDGSGNLVLAAPAGGSTALTIGPIVNGRWTQGMPVDETGTTSAGWIANRCLAHWMELRAGTIDAFALHILTGVASSTYRLGLYLPDDDGKPGTLVVAHAGALSGASSGEQSAAVAHAIAAGGLWGVVQTGATAGATSRTAALASRRHLGRASGDTASAKTLVATRADAALPSSLAGTSWTFDASNIPHGLMVRYSA